MAHALAETGARILVLERGDFIPQEAENWDPEAVWKHLRYQSKERWLDEGGREFRPYTHYNVGGNTKFWGSVLYRLRREDFQAVEHRDGVSPAWPIDYETLAPYYDRAEQMYHVRGQARPGPDGAAARPVSVRGRAARPGHGCHRRAAARLRPAPFAAPARTAEAGGGERLHPVQHLQFVRLPHSREKRGRRLCRASRAAPWERHALDPRLRASADHRRARAPAGGGRGGARGAHGARRSAALHRLVRRRQFGGAPSPVGQRSPSRGAGQLVRARRPALHGAPCDHDAGLPSLPAECDGVPEDRRDQRLLLRRPALTLSARPDPVAGADARRHGADRLPAASRCGPTRRGWRAAWTGW